MTSNSPFSPPVTYADVYTYDGNPDYQPVRLHLHDESGQCATAVHATSGCSIDVGDRVYCLAPEATSPIPDELRRRFKEKCQRAGKIVFVDPAHRWLWMTSDNRLSKGLSKQPEDLQRYGNRLVDDIYTFSRKHHEPLHTSVTRQYILTPRDLPLVECGDIRHFFAAIWPSKTPQDSLRLAVASFNHRSSAGVSEADLKGCHIMSRRILFQGMTWCESHGRVVEAHDGNRVIESTLFHEVDALGSPITRVHDPARWIGEIRDIVDELEIDDERDARKFVFSDGTGVETTIHVWKREVIQIIRR
ncbi:Uu.00g023140.m01.CDS01 [Anthostomella pinea]|uniref:Uu.00g023140.m01.CDS01 n=1 Tax=Anthostomella pinea TaxID=933095 RepID=A0AAI8YR17_9PEZI|nr:Uu.00g023140.m01.CDS01 [Anthostomella pinea]